MMYPRWPLDHAPSFSWSNLEGAERSNRCARCGHHHALRPNSVAHELERAKRGRSRNGKNRTLSHSEWSQRSEFTMSNTLVLAPNVVSGEIDVFPAER